MRSKIFLYTFLFFTTFSVKGQLSLNIRKLEYEKFKQYIPLNKFVSDIEDKYQGHIFEISLFNYSDKSISLPLDTSSYALPYTENIKQYYKGEDFRSEPDLFNVLGIYSFLYQNGNFISQEFDMPFDLEILPRADQKEKDIKKTQRETKIKKWKAENKFNSDLQSIYNWYILNSIITIPPNSEYSYKIYFNPFLKTQDVYDYHEFYFQLNPKITYEITFKIILNKNIYKFLTKEDKEKFKNLFIGVITSNTINVVTESRK